MTTDQGKNDSSDPDWQAIPENIRQAMKCAWANGMPPLASAVYGRWWQLESWWRSLVYVELRASRGGAWADVLPKHYELRQHGDNQFRYMATPDSQNLLAYADARALFDITLQHWELFEPALLSRNVWTGRIDELLAIRNRIGHCRRPHLDDLARLEQTLRDLNGGAFAAIAAFNNQWRADMAWTDVLVDSWLRDQHETASTLIRHAQNQYDTAFDLRYSRRPWAKPPVIKQTIDGIPGYIWHASWYFRGGRGFHLDKFWRDIEPYAENIFLVCVDSPSSVSVSFAAMEDPAAIADTIGQSFDAALLNLGHELDRDGFETWQGRYAELDPRVQVATPWAMIEDSMRGVSIFGA